MLNKVNRTQQKIVNLLVFIGLLLSGKSFAQSCDPYIQKALEQTHITTFSKVSYGATAEFVIRYPLNDTKYTLTDQDGNTYVYRYSYSQPADEKVTIEIPVGVTTKERRFALKAENGLCTYTTSFDYTIKPISSVTHELAVRVEDEWCANAAGIFFSVVGQGTSNSDYDFFYKKASDAAYPTSPLSALKVEGIGAGTYDIKAVKKIAPYTTLTQQVTIRADNEPIAYTAQYIPALCTGNGSIRVKVTSGKFPLTYTLINADNGTVVRPRQSSNVFLDVPAGNYKVKVTDNCSFGGGNASEQVVVASNQILKFTKIREDLPNKSQPLVHEYSCNFVAFKKLELRGENIEKVWEADAFPYPFEVKWEFVSPTNHTYYYAKNITNRTDLEQAFKLSGGEDQDGHKFLEWKEHVYQSTPKEFGIWRITAHITACGTTQTLPYVARAAEDPMKDITFETDNAGGCNPAVKAVRYGYYAPYIPVYYVLERYPAHFDPNAAGFYKIHTSHPDMQDKFVKLLDTRTQVLIPSGLLNVGDKVQFRVVSADCPTRSELYQELTIRTGVTESPAVLYLSQVASCKGVTATGTEYASLRIENMYNSAQIARIVITDFTGDRTKLPAGMSIPYVVPDSDRIRKDLWIVKDLPAGTYTIKYTDTCGYEKTRTDAIISPEAYTLSWSTDCLPKVSGNLAQKPKGNVLYSIERYDAATKTWKPASSNGNPLPILGAEGASESLISGELKGKFRIVRRTFTHTENQDKGPYECTQVLSEKEYKGSLEGLNAVGFGCGTFQPGNPPKYHIALIPKGGQPPYTYTLVTKDGTIVNRPSTDGNFFLNVDPDNLNTRYVFKVRDNCGDERTYDEVISNFLPPQLTTSQEYYCVGQKAILSVPDLGDKIKIEWYRSDNPTHVIHRGTTLEVFPLTEDDFTHTYGVRFVAEYDNDVNACIARANISAYQLRKANDYPAFTAPNALSLEKCAPVDTTPEIFDLNNLFINRDITVGQYADLVVRIVDKAGVIEVPTNGQVNINSPEYAGRTNTFVYEVVRPCGEVLVRAEATLKVRKTTASDKVKTQIVICQEDITYAEVAQLILSQSDPAVSQAALAFHWYTSAQDAQNETNEKQASDAVGTIPNGGNKTLYLRVQQNYLCPSATLNITLSRTSTTALAPQNFGAICALTVGELKKRIDPVNHAKIILYQNGVALADAYQLSSGTSLTYSKQEGTCLTAQSPVTVTIQPHSVAEPKVIPLCTQYWKEYGFSYVNIGELRAALRALYPSAKADGIKIYDQDKNLQSDYNILRVDSSAFFTIEENGKCPSDYYSVTVLEKEHTPAHAEALTLCPDATVGVLRTLLVAKGYTGTLNIYKNDGLQMNDSDPVDWNMLDKYTFTIEQAPKCPSRHMTLSLERSTNLTPAVARTVALCSTTTPTVGQVKAAIGPSAKLYLQNGNNWDEQADVNAINLSILDKYFYTIQESGKCVSEKTPLLIAPKPEKPTGVNANQTFCAADQKRVRDLAPQGADLYWYDVPSGGAPLSSGTLLQTATYYVARANDSCESDREVVNVTITPAPQLTEVSTNPTYVPVGGGNVTLSFKGTPNATVTFKVGTGAEQTIVLDNAGEEQSVQTISSSTVVTIEKITIGTCSQILNKELGIPEKTSPVAYKYQQSSNQLVCEGTQVTIRLEALMDSYLGGGLPFPPPNRPNLLQREQLWVSTDGGANYTEDTAATLVGVKQVDSDPNAPDKYIYTYTFTATEAINNNKYKLKVAGNFLGVRLIWVEMEPVTISVQYLKIQTQPVVPAPYCKGATVTPLTVVAKGNDTNYTYQWYQNNTNSKVGATPILGANAASYTPSTDLIGTTYYFVKVANDAGCNTEESNIIPITVKKSLTITKQPSHATYCEGDTVLNPFKVEATGEGLTYEWFQNTSPIIHGGTSTGVTTNTYTPNTSSTGITYYYCVVKDNCGNEERTIPVRVTINKKTTITAPPVGATYCQNDTVTPLRVVAEGSGTLQYKWYQTATAINTGGMHVGTDAPNYIPSLTTAGTFYYYVEVIGQCETVRSNSITFVVKQAPAPPTLSVESFNCTENTKVKVTSSRTLLTFHAADNSAYTLNGNGEITPTPAVGTHTLRAKNSNGCYSLPVNFVVKGKTAPDKPVLEVHENATCTDKTKIKIVGYEASLGYKYYLVGSPTELTVSTQGVITTDLAVGTHKLYAKKDSCDSPQSDDFTIEAPKTPETPTLAKISDPDCTNPTLMRITNISQYTGATYTFIDIHNTAVSATVDTGTGAITDLPAGKYKLKVTQNGCTSAFSALFTIDEQFPNPAKPTIVAEDAASCDNPSTVKISNVVPTNDVSYTFTNTVTNTTVTATVNRTTGVVTGLAAGTYKVTATKGTCTETSAEFTITAAKGRPDEPTVTTEEQCDAVSTAKITNVKSTTEVPTYAFINTVTSTTVTATVDRTTGVISGLGVGKYKVTATKDSCDKQSAEFEIKAAKGRPDEPTVTTEDQCDTVTTAKITNVKSTTEVPTYAFINTVTSTTVTATVDRTTGVISGLGVGKYKVTATKDGCDKQSAEFEIKAAKGRPDQPTVTTEDQCDAVSTAKITNVKSTTEVTTYTFINTVTSTTVTATVDRTTGVISGLGVGKYKVTATKDGCDKQSAEFEIKAAKGRPDQPTVTTEEQCDAVSTAKITNVKSTTEVTTYTFINTITSATATATVDRTTGVISGLGVGKYKVTATKDGCDKQSAEFEIKAAKGRPDEPTVTTEEQCDAVSTAKITNVKSTTEVTTYTFINTITSTTVNATVDRTTGVISGLGVGKYKVTATKDGCDKQSAEFEIKAAKGRPDQPVVTTEDQCDAVSTAKITNVKSTTEVPTYTFINSVTNTTVTATVDRTTGVISGLGVGKYKVTATKDGCDKQSAEFEIKAKLPVPETPTVMVAPPTCTAISAAKVSNYTDYPHGETFTVTDSNGTVIGAVDNAGNITGLTTAGTYTLTITRSTCRAAAVDFDIADKLPTPAKPEITLTPASCTSPTVAKLKNQASGLTYWYNGTQLTVNPITHEIMGLAPGTYTITAKNNNNCESVASDSFEIKAQQTATTITTAPAGATYQKGDEATLLAVVATGEGTLSYKWYKNRDNNNTSGTEVGDNSPSYKPATDMVGSFYYWVEVTSDCGAVKSAVAEIKVVEGAPTIEANDDPDTTVRRGQEVAVLGNDKVNGNPATPADVDITISNDGGLTRVGVNPATGKIMIPNDAAPATYEITYKICVKNQPTICDEAKVKITVEVPVRALKAVDDDFGKVPNTVDYTTTNTVFSTGVDTLEGVPGILSPETDVILRKGAVTRQDGTAIQAGTITMNDNGSITVKQGTPIGVYTYTYSICEKAVPTNCSEEAKATFEVVDNTILAKDDEFEVGTLGGLTPSILINDILKGKVGLTTDDVEIQDTEGEARADSHLVREADGRVTVKPGIVARPEPYLYYYTIKEKANPANTSNAVIKIKVVSFTAVDDEDEVINEGTKEKKIPSVLRNDDIDGKRPEPEKNVIFTPSKVKDKDGNEVPGIVINEEDGSITIAPNTPDGVYTYSYTICKKTVPNECKTAKGILKLLPALVAGDDLDFKPVNVTKGAVNVGNILANDLYAGEKVLDHLDKVTVTLNGNDGSGAYIDEQGNLIVPQGAPVKEYEFTYDLCIKGHPGACKTATIKVEVIKDKPLTIYNGVSADADGHNDYFKIDGIEYYPKNNLKIFNRWGVLVYEKDGYSNEAPFDGHSNGRATISADSKLPQGTYYYILEYEDSDDQSHTEKGWLYLKY